MSILTKLEAIYNEGFATSHLTGLQAVYDRAKAEFQEATGGVSQEAFDDVSAQLTSANAMIASLTEQLTSANAMIASLTPPPAPSMEPPKEADQAAQAPAAPEEPAV